MFTLDQVVPWGRSLDEYRRMFALTEADLALQIVGCGDGPASFNAEMTRQGGRVVSCDPIYRWDSADIERRIAETSETVLAQTRQNADEFVWNGGIRSVDELANVRMGAMRLFLEDFDAGKVEGRYVDAELPTLPLSDGAFDLALCSHYLFLYSVQMGESFHLAAIREMCRVASEVRIFPLLALGGQPSPHVGPCVSALRGVGHQVSLERVPYEFQRGAHHMMRIRTGSLDGQRPGTTDGAPHPV